MSFKAILDNTVAVCKAAGFREADTRYPIEDAHNGGADRCFSVSGSPVSEAMSWLALPQNRRRSTVVVRLRYFRGGGDAGGESHGGDRASVCARAVTDTLTLAQWLTNPRRYGSQTIGINRVVSPAARKVIDADQFEVWELELRVEWEQVQNARAVPA